MREKAEYRNFKQIVNKFYNEEINNINADEIGIKKQGTIKIVPRIIYDKFSGNLKIEFSIGKNKLYKIKNLSEFYLKMLNKEDYRYKNGLQFVHTKEIFDQDSQKLLDFMLKYAEIIKYANSNSNSNYKYFGKALNEDCIIVGNNAVDELFDILNEQEVDFFKDGKEEKVKFVQRNPKIEFELKETSNNDYVISPNVDLYKLALIDGKEYKYLLQKNTFYRCDKEFENTNLNLLALFRKNYITDLKLGEEQLIDFFSVIMPKMHNSIVIKNIDKEKIEKYKPKPLEVKAFFDFDNNNNIISNIVFKYGKVEFNPLDENTNADFPRNIIEETKTLNIFRRTGFMFDTKNLRFVLPDNDKIYDFLSEDIKNYMRRFEVLVTENFKTKQIMQPKIGSLGIKIENDLLSITLENLNIDFKDLKDVMERYQLKKKYYRLKDGSFLNLQGNNEIEFLEKVITGMDINYKELETGKIHLPVNRTLYLNTILKELKYTSITKNDDYKKFVGNLDKNQLEEIDPPSNLKATLRYYQKIGFKWLKTIDTYKLGGILADDMGLGKTIQVLSVILDYIENNKKEKRASLVIAPSSLALNWKSEAEKYASSINTLVIRGTLQERKALIEQIENYDLVITSYDLLKRDIELYNNKDYKFRFIIADEAQYLKNSNTQNAKAIKNLKADTRYALTGTPIENSLAELWSIFDFIMPGYLYTYKKFKSMFEIPILKENSEYETKKLKMLIEPFILRRTKKEVLTELPDKEITILESQMQEEQEEIYLSYLAKVKEDVAELIGEKYSGKNQIKILAALTRLRQICCHPSLFIKDYKGGSSKLEQCLEITEEAIKSEHKILLFSSYTSMLEIIEKKLKEKDIRYFKLTGATKVEERLNLVNEFNTNSEIKVFLISLKAGGTGLNLTGADMVIHYDPWWNLSTENQATDRAYRIGQKNNVQVYKLITKNSIEEKIYNLQKKKEKLVDNILDTKTTFINKLSKEDILNLFE